MSEKKKTLNTDEVISALGKVWCAPAYAMLTQVRNGTGYEKSARTADAMFMSLWPSRGIYLAGIEVKVSRTDWLKELKDPQKAEDLAKYCDYWYLAVGDPDIVKDGELPLTWGLMVPNDKGGMKIVKEATRLEPVAIDKLFLGAIMRNMVERSIARDLIKGELDAEYKRGKESSKRDGESAQKNYNELFDRVKKFEKEAGFQIDTWHGENIGKAVKEVMDGKHTKAHEKMLKIRDSALNVAKYIDGEIESYQV